MLGILNSRVMGLPLDAVPEGKLDRPPAAYRLGDEGLVQIAPAADDQRPSAGGVQDRGQLLPRVLGRHGIGFGMAVHTQ